MLKLKVLDQSGKKVTEISAPKEVLSAPVKESLLYDAVINYRANQRRGTASTKTRADVSGGGKKPWRQKGTGRARAGSNRSPLWRKGGTTFGPKPRDYSYNLNKKEKRNALRSALSQRFSEEHLLIVDKLEFGGPKTKEGAQLLSLLKIDSALIVDQHDNTNLFLSMRNIPKVKAVDFNQVNTYDVLNHNWLVFSKPAFESLMEKLK